MMNYRQPLLIPLLFTALVPVASALERTRVGEVQTTALAYSVGVEYEEGDYGTADTTQLIRVLLGVHLRQGQWAFGGSLPFITAKSSGNTIIMSSKHTHTVTGSGSRSVSGLGDLSVYASYYLPTASPNTYRLSAILTLGTGDENDGLSTGENSVAIEGGVVIPLEAGTSLFGELGYEFNDDAPTVKYDDSVYGNVGMSWRMESGNRLGAMVEFAQAVTPGFDDELQVTGFLRTKTGNANALYGYLSLGLSDGSPDVSAGVKIWFE